MHKEAKSPSSPPRTPPASQTIQHSPHATSASPLPSPPSESPPVPISHHHHHHHPPSVLLSQAAASVIPFQHHHYRHQRHLQRSNKPIPSLRWSRERDTAAGESHSQTGRQCQTGLACSHSHSHPRSRSLSHSQRRRRCYLTSTSTSSPASGCSTRGETGVETGG